MFRSRVALAVVSLVLLLAGCRESGSIAASSPLTVPVPPAGSKLKVLYVGDSLTGGSFASNESMSFRLLMQRHLAVDVSELWPTLGPGSLGLASRVESVPPGADLVIVELGTNDAGQGVVPGVFDRQYNALLQKIRRGSPAAALLCAGAWTDNARPYDEIIEHSCEQAGGRFVSLARIYSMPGTRGPEGKRTEFGISDNFHPNDLGHREIANALERELVF